MGRAIIEDVKYRGWIISYWAKPIPDRRWDWDFHHEDYDLDDPRHGSAGSLAEAKAEIDNYEDTGDF